MPIAAPRRSGGKIRVITAIVCGVMNEAPRPCTTRAAISSPMLGGQAAHSEASVKTTSPLR